MSPEVQSSYCLQVFLNDYSLLYSNWGLIDKRYQQIMIWLQTVFGVIFKTINTLNGPVFIEMITIFYSATSATYTVISTLC